MSFTKSRVGRFEYNTLSEYLQLSNNIHLGTVSMMSRTVIINDQWLVYSGLNIVYQKCFQVVVVHYKQLYPDLKTHSCIKLH